MASHQSVYISSGKLWIFRVLEPGGLSQMVKSETCAQTDVRFRVGMGVLRWRMDEEGKCREDVAV